MQYLTAHHVFGITELIEKILLECDQKTLLTSACRVSKRWHSVIQTSTQIQQALYFLPVHDDARHAAKPVSNPRLMEHFTYFFSPRRAGQCHHVQGFPELDFYPMFDVRFPSVRAEPADQNTAETSEKPVNPERQDSSEEDDEDGNVGTASKPTTNGAKAGSSSGKQGNTSAGSHGNGSTSDPSAPSRGKHGNHRPSKWKSVTVWPPKDTAKLERYFREGASWRRMLVRQPPVKRLAYAERTLVDVNYAVHPHYDYYKALLESPTAAKPADASSLPMSITTPANASTGGLRMDTLYDTVHLNLSRMTIKDPRDNPEETFLESRFHVHWNGVPKSADCPDDRMRSQIRRAVGKAGKETVVVQILAAERPLNHRILTTPEVVQCFGPRFRSQEAVGDPHFLHKKGTHAITGPDWLKKKWVSDRIDDAGFMMHWTDMTDDFDDLDDFDEFEPFMFQDLLDHHMMGLHDYLYMDHDLGWDVWDEYYHDFP